MKDTISKFELVLATAAPRLAEISESDAAHKPDPKRWSKKEILGHLIDSASNNHQRIVRAQLTSRLDFPNYEQEFWVERQAYATEPWADLINLWLLLNRHLLHVVKAMPADVYRHDVRIGASRSMTLSAVVDGYLSHLDNHLAQIFS